MSNATYPVQRTIFVAIRTHSLEFVMKSIAAYGLFMVLFAGSSLQAQGIPEFPKPQKEHEWLNQFAGEWTTESEASMGPGQPPVKCSGKMTSRMLGGYWVISDVKSEMMGTAVTAVQTIGYDPQSKKYVGTWVDSMMNHLWKYTGTVDETGNILTLEAEGPNFLLAGKQTNFRDVYEFKTKDHILVSSMMQTEDGKWTTFMTGNYRRKK